MLESIIARAADTENQTPAERAAALTLAARIAAEGNTIIVLPDPPDGWCWRDGKVVRAAPSTTIPPLREVPDRWSEQAWRKRLFGEPERPAPVAGEIAVQEALPAPAKPRPRRSPRPPRPAGGRAGQDVVLEMIRRPGGATTEELVRRSGLKPHSVRGVICIAKRVAGAPHIVYDKGTKRYMALEA